MLCVRRVFTQWEIFIGNGRDIRIESLYELSIGRVFIDHVMDFKCLLCIGHNVLMELLFELSVCGMCVDRGTNL